MIAPRLVVVGGGITGLAAAHHLLEIARDEGRRAEVIVLEASERLGGNVRTAREGPYVIEAGPDTIVTHKPAGLRLVGRLGLEDSVVPIRPRAGATEVVRRGRRLPIPEGFLLIAPTRVGPVLRSPLLSPLGKLRLLLEPWVPARPRSADDESLASFVSRRLGREVLDRIAEPVAAGCYMTRAERLGLRATMPRFLDLEREHGSLARGFRAAVAARRDPPPAPFVAIRGGLGRLVDALADRLPPGSVRLSSRVAEVRADSASARYEVRVEGGGAIAADAVVLACPAWAAAEAVRGLDAPAAAAFSTLEYASCATVHLAYASEDVSTPPASLGFFVPRGEGSPLVACSHVSVKFPERAPTGELLVRAFLGGESRPGSLDGDDAALVARSHAALVPLLGLRRGPCFSRVFRFDRVMPQFRPGDTARIAILRRSLEAHPALVVAGSAAGAFGIPDCVASGEEAARAAWREIASRSSTELEATG